MPLITAIQMTSTTSVQDNLATAARLIAEAAAAKSSIAVLPEMFPLMGDTHIRCGLKESVGEGPIQDFLSAQAKRNKIWIIGGTIPIRVENDPARVYAACFVYDDQGKAVARYDKMHLFDACLSPGSEEYRESDNTTPGDHLTVIDSPVGKLGLAVCYDMRFPELFRALTNRGAEVIAVPVAFTCTTGIAHWEVLARSRAIENLVYAVYAGQTGTHAPGRMTYGHSMIVDPWGKILQQLGDECGTISAEIDLDYLKKLRQTLRVLDHQRL
jgi:predicted amidohydrolase